mmetsp:Transcript_20789/g.66329  ORF Transcript_20789/g.66329 Transcript_20789/m.66329 type:complete len:336 (-) Transcript_20789:321-1328(-)
MRVVRAAMGRRSLRAPRQSRFPPHRCTKCLPALLGLHRPPLLHALHVQRRCRSLLLQLLLLLLLEVLVAHKSVERNVHKSRPESQATTRTRRTRRAPGHGSLHGLVVRWYGTREDDNAGIGRARCGLEHGDRAQARWGVAQGARAVGTRAEGERAEGLVAGQRHEPQAKQTVESEERADGASINERAAPVDLAPVDVDRHLVRRQQRDHDGARLARDVEGQTRAALAAVQPEAQVRIGAARLGGILLEELLLHGGHVRRPRPAVVHEQRREHAVAEWQPRYLECERLPRHEVWAAHELHEPAQSRIGAALVTMRQVHRRVRAGRRRRRQRHRRRQ